MNHNDKLHLLIVEDSEDDALLLLRELKKAGYENIISKRVDTAKDMSEALDNEKWDIIISDYSMPSFSAIDALRLLKDKNHDIPFIVLSGAIGEETAVDIMKAGAHDYINKGSLSRLIPAVQRELREAEIRENQRLSAETIRLNEVRFKALYNLSMMNNASIKDIEGFVIKEAVKLTKSKVGFIGYRDNKDFVINIWLRDNIDNENFYNKDIDFDIDNYDIFKEIIFSNKSILINDIKESRFRECEIFKKLDIDIERFLSVSISNNDDEFLFMLAANNDFEYKETDVRQLELLLNGLWQNIQKRKDAVKIKKSLEEKEILLKEIHHRVKNNLQIISSLLNLQSRYTTNKEALGLFKESQNRIKTMALVHEKLYQSNNLAEINFKNYIRSITINLFHSYGVNSEKINVEIDIMKVLFGIDIAIPCGLIVNELVSNAVKHAFPDPDTNGNIFVGLDKNDFKTFTLIVSDDGVGISEEYSLENPSSLGLQLVKALVTQLDGSIVINNKSGTEFAITFENKETKKRI